VVTGQTTEVVPTDTYRRLGSDFKTAAVPVVGDLHGAELEAFLKGGPLDILKVSDEDLIADGLLQDNGEEASIAAIRELAGRGAGDVVLSCSHRPALALMDDVLYRITPPPLEPAEAAGAGDSMTAGLAAGITRELTPEDSLRLACGAGAANVTRHGLGSASGELITKLAERMKVEVLADRER
jgi:1-phosphofructokinase